jgi:hypothetical protein
VKRIALLLALALAVLLAGGCGSAQTDEDQEQPERASFTAAQVIREFKQAPGTPALRSAAGTDVAWQQLSFGLNVSRELQQRYGTFNVYVVKRGHDDAVTSLLRNKETKEPLERGADGVFWELDTLSNSYVAYKRYGANVVLAWWSEGTEPVTDERFARLDELLTGLMRA